MCVPILKYFDQVALINQLPTVYYAKGNNRQTGALNSATSFKTPTAPT